MSRKVCLFVLCLSALLGWQSSAWAKDTYELIIKRSERKLLVEKNGKVMQSFHTALGMEKGAKQIMGDKRTPAGKYQVMDIRGSDRFYLFIALNYPNVQDAINGLRQQNISHSEYRRIIDAHLEKRLPPQNTKLGGLIGIHGIGTETEEKIDIHEAANWTQGCIAVRNKEMDILKQYIRRGTTVIIED